MLTFIGQEPVQLGQCRLLIGQEFHLFHWSYKLGLSGVWSECKTAILLLRKREWIPCFNFSISHLSPQYSVVKIGLSIGNSFKLDFGLVKVKNRFNLLAFSLFQYSVLENFSFPRVVWMLKSFVSLLYGWSYPPQWASTWRVFTSDASTLNRPLVLPTLYGFLPT